LLALEYTFGEEPGGAARQRDMHNIVFREFAALHTYAIDLDSDIVQAAPQVNGAKDGLPSPHYVHSIPHQGILHGQTLPCLKRSSHAYWSKLTQHNSVSQTQAVSWISCRTVKYAKESACESAVCSHLSIQTVHHCSALGSRSLEDAGHSLRQVFHDVSQAAFTHLAVDILEVDFLGN
jgi:hypothetical protein